MMEESAKRMAAGVDPGIIPERFLIGAARVALNKRMARPGVITKNFYHGAGEEIVVALEATFRDLSVCLHRLHDALNALQVTLGDKPPDDESAMADWVETAVLDVIGIWHKARKAALERA